MTTRQIEKGTCIHHVACGIGRVIHVRGILACTIRFDNFIATATPERDGKFTLKLMKNSPHPISGQTLTILPEPN